MKASLPFNVLVGHHRNIFNGLDCLGDVNRTKEEIVKEATKFIGLCYGLPSGNDMSEKRYT